MINYLCYMGTFESQRYTIQAKNLKDLKKRLIAKWDWHTNMRWYKNEVPKGYPKGALRFIVKEKHGSYRYPNLGRMQYPILIIPR